MKNRLLTILTLLISMTIYAQNPPFSLQATVSDNDVQLEWSEPLDGEIIPLSWTTGINTTSLGYNGSEPYVVAARFSAADISSYDGIPIFQVEFFVNEAGADLSVKIFKGTNGDQVVYEQPISNAVEGAWNLITLNNPPLIDGSTDLWIGIEVFQNGQLVFPAGIDTGPAVPGFGDMINYQGYWESIYDYGFDQNFSLRAYALAADGNRIAIGQPTSPAVFSKQGGGEISTVPTEQIAAPERSNRSANAVPDSYNIYRNSSLIGSSTTLNYSDLNLENGIYTYGVTAVYGTDESAPAQTMAQVGSPDFIVLPEVFVDTFPMGTMVTRSIELQNNGTVPLIFTVEPSNYYVGLDVYDGTVQPGTSLVMNVYFYTYSYVPGTYVSSLVFNTNDVAFPTYNYDMQFTVLAQPGFFIISDNIAFGDVIIEQPAVRQVGVHNSGYDTLVLTNFVSSSPYFAAAVDSLVIPQYEAGYIPIIFTPDAVGDFNGTLEFNTNDPEVQEYTLTLSGSGIVPSPFNLTTQIVDSTNVSLAWAGVNGDEGTWLTYSSDNYSNSVGLVDSTTFDIAAGWPAAVLSAYEGQAITYVAFFPTSEETTYTLKLWSGNDLSTEIYSQPVTEYNPYQWNVVTLDNPVAIDGATSIFAGFTINQAYYEFPAAYDEGPNVPGYSDMINLYGNWEPLNDYGFFNNWMIKAFVAQSGTASPINIAALPELRNTAKNESLSLHKYTFTIPENNGRSVSSLDFQGYNLYRNGSVIGSLLTENEYFDANLELGTYEYGLTAVYDQGESNAISKVVQIGAPIMVLNPAAINDSVESGTIGTFPVSISNQGMIELEWSVGELPYGVSFSANSGSLAPGESQNYVLTFDAQLMYPSLRQLQLVFETNNLNDPTTVLPLTIQVTGDAALVFSVDSIDFGMVDLNEQIIRSFQVVNNTPVPAFIYTYSYDYHFQAYATNFHLLPGDTTDVMVSFSASEIGPYNADVIVEAYLESDQYLFEIPVSAYVILPMPSSLTGTLSNDTVSLSWYPPGITPGLLQYGNGGIQTAIGYAGPGTFEAAAKFGPDILGYYPNESLTHIGFYTWSDLSNFTLKVYSGENAETLLLEQPVESVAVMGWNDVELVTPVPVDPTGYLWIGYELSQDDVDFAAGVDFGPAVMGKGDLVRLEGEEWMTLSDYGLPYNWNIRGWVGDSADSSMRALTPVTTGNFMPSTLTAENLQKAPFAFTQSENRSVNNVLLGYNIYRNGQALNSSPVNETNWTDVLTAPGGYLYEVTSVFDLGESLPTSVFINNDTTVNMPEGWDYIQTAFVHNIYIPVEAAMRSGMEMSSGDVIGVFYHIGSTAYCAGAVAYQNGQLMITAYGDDPMTPEKEGFEVGEPIYWKVYIDNQEYIYDMNVTYDGAMPQHDGKYHINGLSMLASMETTILNVAEAGISEVRVYPNPSQGIYTIAGLNAGDEVRIMDATGRVVDQFVAQQNSTQLQSTAKGLYLIQVSRGNVIEHKKLLIH